MIECWNISRIYLLSFSLRTPAQEKNMMLERNSCMKTTGITILWKMLPENGICFLPQDNWSFLHANKKSLSGNTWNEEVIRELNFQDFCTVSASN